MLEREGIGCQLFALDPARANLVARIKGTGTKKPLLVMGHTDVVGVQRDKWTVDPFGAVNKNGFIYARGARDDKPHVVAGMMILLLLKRLNMQLDRDVIFLAEAGEEGTSTFGIDYMVKQHWAEIEAEFAMAEGGSIVEEQRQAASCVDQHHREIAAAHTAGGARPGGSRFAPGMANAVVHLAEAVARAGTWQTPMRLNETTRTYFERLAAISPPQSAERYRDILNPARAADVDAYFRESEPGHYSILRTSVVPTIINIGFRSNVIPSEGEAMLDVRALPDEDMTKFVAELRRVIGDASIEVIPPKTNARPVSPPSRIDTELFRAFEKVGRRMFNVPTLPNMMTGATDNAQLRAKGVQAYGTGPIVSPEEGPLGGAHGDDEHIAVRSLMALIEYLWNVLMEVG